MTQPCLTIKMLTINYAFLTYYYKENKKKVFVLVSYNLSFLLHLYQYLFGLYTFECQLEATFINTEFKLDSNLRTIPSLKGNGHIFVKWQPQKIMLLIFHRICRFRKNMPRIGKQQMETSAYLCVQISFFFQIYIFFSYLSR